MNTKYFYYIVSLDDGDVRGTNDDNVAGDYAASEDFIVIDAELGEWLQATGNSADIPSA